MMHVRWGFNAAERRPIYGSTSEYGTFQVFCETNLLWKVNYPDFDQGFRVCREVRCG